MAAGAFVEEGMARALSGAGTTPSTVDSANVSLSPGCGPLARHVFGSACDQGISTHMHSLATNANRLRRFRRRARRRKGDELLVFGASDSMTLRSAVKYNFRPE